MGLTSAENLTKALIEGWDTQYLQGLYRKQCRAFGDSRVKEFAVNQSSGGRFPDFPYIKLRLDEIGVSHRILGTQELTLAKILRADFQPEWPDIQKQVAEVLKQFYLARSMGDGRVDGEWLDQHTATFLDGDGLGLGFTLVGLKKNPKTGKNRVHLENIPILRCAYDRHTANFGRARWAMVKHYMPVEEAQKQFGKNAVKDCEATLQGVGDQTPIPIVRMFEVWTTGLGGDDPIHAFIPGTFENKPITIEANPDGASIPIAHYEHFLRPGMLRPTGRIDALQYLEESLNDNERAMNAESKRHGFDVIPADLYDTDDLAKINNGEIGVILKAERPLMQGEPPYERVSAGEISQTRLERQNMMERQFTAASGTTDADRGLLSQQTKTLGENQLVDARSSVQSNRSVQQLALYGRRVVEKTMMVAARGDVDPIAVNIFGQQIMVNDPSQPVSSIATFVQEAAQSRILITEASLMKGDQQQEMAQNMSRLQPYAPFVGTLVDPEWFITEYLEAGGYDPKEALMQQGQQLLGGQTQPTQAPPNPNEVGQAPQAPV